MIRLEELRILILKFIGQKDSLTARVAKGAGWLYALEFSNKGLRFIQAIILARFLTPEGFGLLGIAVISRNALEIFSQTGFQKTLVQRKNIDNNLLDVAWTTSVIRGAILFLILFLAAPLVSAFFETARAVPIIKMLALVFLIKGFENVGTIYFSKNFEFHRTFIWKISSLFVNVGVTIPLAVILRNEWAIVWGMLASSIASTTISYGIHPYKPRIKLDIDIAKNLFRYGKWILLQGVVVFLSKQGDKIVLTKLLGVTTLGIYVMALRFADMPTSITGTLRKVLFPAYASIQDSVQRLRDAYLKVLSTVAYLCMPACGGIFVLAHPFVIIFLGEKWEGAIIPLQILSLSILIKIITDSSAVLFNAFGKPSFTFKMVTFRVIILAIFVVPLTKKYGMNGVALSFLISSASGAVPWAIGINKFFQISIKKLKILIVPLCNTVIMILGVYYFSRVFPLKSMLDFLMAVLTGSFIYILLTAVSYRLKKIA